MAKKNNAEPMAHIIIPRGRRTEENFVIVSVNGKSYKIMKGVEVEVPECVAQVLENADMMAQTARAYMERMAE